MVTVDMLIRKKKKKKSGIWKLSNKMESKQSWYMNKLITSILI